MYRTRLLKDRASFTTDTNLINLAPGRYIDELTISYKLDTTAASSVTVANTLDLVNPLSVRMNGSSIIDVRGSDLYALNVLVFNSNPLTIVSTAATDSQTKIMGLKAPIYAPGTESGNLTTQLTRAAVTGADSETLSLCEHSYDEQLNPGPLHYVTISATSSASTGYGNRTELPQVGSLQGILFYSTTIPTATAETATVQAVRLEISGDRSIERNWHELAADSTGIGFVTLEASTGDTTILDNYRYLDLSKNPIESSTSVLVDVNGGVASEAYRMIPIYNMGNG